MNDLPSDRTTEHDDAHASDRPDDARANDARPTPDDDPRAERTGSAPDDEPDMISSIISAVRERPATAFAVGAALFVLSRTPIGRVARPAIRLAMRTGIAASLVARAGERLRGSRH
ncbi:MAG: hypothetical protein R3E87_05030 [Burkholderiaceae bacterium]